MLSKINEFSIKGIEGIFKEFEHNAINVDTDKENSIYMNGSIGICFYDNLNICDIDIDEVYTSRLMSYTNRYIVNRSYKHWKNGKTYYAKGFILDVFGNEYILYQALYGSHLYYLRGVNDFLSKIPKGREKENKFNKEYRFELIS